MEQRLALLALLTGAIAPALLAGLTPVQTALACAAAAASIVFGLRRLGWLGAARRLMLACSLPDGRWQLVDGSGRNMTGTLLPDSRVGSRWVWLRWDVREHGAPLICSMLLFEGDIAAIDMRRLIVRLRLASAPVSRGTASGLRFPSGANPPVDHSQVGKPQVGMHSRRPVGRFLRARP